MRSRCATCRNFKQTDGPFDIEVTSTTGFTAQREGLA
jgi:hypothetical protein